MSSARAPARF
jgi:hypothetical protein